MELQNVEIYRGDNRTFQVTVKDGDGVAVDITGAAIKFSVKEEISDTDYEIQKTVGSGITITDAANGIYEVYLLPADTQNMGVGIYEYDSELTTAGGNVYTVVRGEFTVQAEITRPVS